MVIAFLFYIFALYMYTARHFLKKERYGEAAFILYLTGFIFHSLSLVIRTIYTGHVPYATFYESVISFSWAVALIYAIFAKTAEGKKLGIFTMLFLVVFLGYSSTLDKSAGPLSGALQSHWLAIHVGAYLIAYGALTAAFGANVTYLWRAHFSAGKEKVHRRFDELTSTLVAAAFPFMTIGLVTGSLWARSAWGRYWSWDPKETWALIGWLIYGLCLYCYSRKGRLRGISAYLALVGFIVVLFNFIGVTLFLKGMHSYA